MYLHASCQKSTEDLDSEEEENAYQQLVGSLGAKVMHPFLERMKEEEQEMDDSDEDDDDDDDHFNEEVSENELDLEADVHETSLEELSHVRRLVKYLKKGGD